MKRLLLALLLLPSIASAQIQCTGATGIGLISDPYPPGSNQPTSCRLLKDGVQIASGPVVLSSTLPVAPISTCFPTQPNYNPGPAGSVACSLGSGNLSPGTYTFSGFASNGAGESPAGPGLVITIVTALPTIPTAPTLHPR
jgi:hypothetical protein